LMPNTAQLSGPNNMTSFVRELRFLKEHSNSRKHVANTKKRRGEHI